MRAASASHEERGLNGPVFFTGRLKKHNELSEKKRVGSIGLMEEK